MATFTATEEEVLDRLRVALRSARQKWSEAKSERRPGEEMLAASYDWATALNSIDAFTGKPSDRDEAIDMMAQVFEAAMIFANALDVRAIALAALHDELFRPKPAVDTRTKTESAPASRQERQFVINEALLELETRQKTWQRSFQEPYSRRLSELEAKTDSEKKSANERLSELEWSVRSLRRLLAGSDLVAGIQTIQEIPVRVYAGKYTSALIPTVENLVAELGFLNE